MTGHCSVNKMAYNVIWNEKAAGPGSNELASAVIVILEHVICPYPDTKTATL